MEFGRWRAVYLRFVRGSTQNVWQDMFDALQDGENFKEVPLVNYSN